MDIPIDTAMESVIMACKCWRETFERRVAKSVIVFVGISSEHFNKTVQSEDING